MLGEAVTDKEFAEWAESMKTVSVLLSNVSGTGMPV